MNPHLNVFVSFVSLSGADKLEMSPVLAALLAYPNIHLNRLDLRELSTGSPLEGFIESDRLHDSKFIVSHSSDVLRLLMLWKYGGTYLDLDVIVRKRLDSVKTNFVCDDVGNIVNGAVMNFVNTKAGRVLVEEFMTDLAINFNGTGWGCNGPYMITRVLKRLCKTNETLEMVAMQDCEGFHVLPRHFCYPIMGFTWADLFNENFGESVMRQVNESIVVHFWNNLSKSTQLSVNSSAGYARLARLFCPKVISSCGDFF
jgi:lactosylceramide 4-alpha-galactosyltransferase